MKPRVDGVGGLCPKPRGFHCFARHAPATLTLKTNVDDALNVSSRQDQAAGSWSGGGAFSDPARVEQPEHQRSHGDRTKITGDRMSSADTTETKHEADQCIHRRIPCDEVE